MRYASTLASGASAEHGSVFCVEWFFPCVHACDCQMSSEALA
jgi:hypothetical protein